MHRGAERGRVLTGGGTAWSSTVRAEFVPVCPHQGPHRLKFGCFGSVRKQRFLVSCPRVSWPTPNPVGSVPDGASLRDQCGESPPRGLGKEKGEGGAASPALLRFHLHVPIDARASSTIPPEKTTLKPQRLHLLPPRSPAGCPHAGPGHFCRVKRRRRRERGKAAGLGWTACPRRIPAGSTGGPRDGNGAAHEWEMLHS